MKKHGLLPRKGVVAALLSLPIMAAVWAGTARAQANPDVIRTTDEVSQAPGVLARFPDLAMKIDAPSLAPGHSGFTSEAERAAFTRSLAQRAAHLAILKLGDSGKGLPLEALLFTREGVADLAAAARLGRPVLWFIGQQHGNEPAGGEGMLAFAAELAKPDMREKLGKVSVVIVPRANPDGAAAFTRASAARADLNRDHLLHFQPETRALHAAMAVLPPDVVFDHHEFSVVNRWIEKLNAIQAVDAMILHATNPMVPSGLSSLSEEIFRPAIEREFARNGLRMAWYYTTSNRRSDPVVSMGGNNPGIARNAFGLRGAASFLVETRGVGIRKQGWQRRVGTHVVAALAVFETSVAMADTLGARIGTARREAAASTAPIIVNARIPAIEQPLLMMDPETGADRIARVPFQDSRRIDVAISRQRPEGYLLRAEARGVLERFERLGVTICRLAGAQQLPVLAYTVTEQRKQLDAETINPDQVVRVSTENTSRDFAAGSLFIPMRQAGSGLIASVLEPDMPGSFLGMGIIEMAAGSSEAPVYALPSGTVPRLAADGGSICR